MSVSAGDDDTVEVGPLGEELVDAPGQLDPLVEGQRATGHVGKLLRFDDDVLVEVRGLSRLAASRSAVPPGRFEIVPPVASSLTVGSWSGWPETKLVSGGAPSLVIDIDDIDATCGGVRRRVSSRATSGGCRAIIGMVGFDAYYTQTPRNPGTGDVGC